MPKTRINDSLLPSPTAVASRLASSSSTTCRNCRPSAPASIASSVAFPSAVALLEAMISCAAFKLASWAAVSSACALASSGVSAAAGVRSPVFKLTVVELPYVQKLDLEYTFPAYTGLEPRKVENGGDIAVLGGTDVAVTITPTMATTGGELLIGEDQRVPLAAAADGTLTARFTVKDDGFYRVELDAPSGSRVTASPQYTIDVLTDQFHRYEREYDVRAATTAADATAILQRARASGQPVAMVVMARSAIKLAVARRQRPATTAPGTGSG